MAVRRKTSQSLGWGYGRIGSVGSKNKGGEIVRRQKSQRFRINNFIRDCQIWPIKSLYLISAVKLGC